MKERKLLDDLGEFQNRSMRAYIEGWEGYFKFQADVVRDPASSAAAYGRFTEVGLKSYKTMVDASVVLAQNLFSVSTDATPGSGKPTVAPEPPAEATAEPAAPAVRELVFEGIVGHTASRQFVVANRTDQPLDVAFEVSEFASGDRQNFRANVDLVPALFTLQTGEEKIVECRIELSGVFIPGTDSRAILRAVGLPEMSMVLTVRVQQA